MTPPHHRLLFSPFSCPQNTFTPPSDSRQTTISMPACSVALSTFPLPFVVSAISTHPASACNSVPTTAPSSPFAAATSMRRTPSARSGPVSRCSWTMTAKTGVTSTQPVSPTLWTASSANASTKTVSTVGPPRTKSTHLLYGYCGSPPPKVRPRPPFSLPSKHGHQNVSEPRLQHNVLR